MIARGCLGVGVGVEGAGRRGGGGGGGRRKRRGG